MAKKLPADDAPVKARVLVQTYIDGKLHEPDSVISLPAAAIKDLEAQGLVDSDEDAVAYAESLK
jgi:hypothetical protein